MIYLGLGSNIGESVKTVRKAFSILEERLGRGRLSSLYRTAPQDYRDQPDFINAVAEIKTNLPLEEVFHITKEVENLLGRKRPSGLKKGPRTLDIDILLYNNLIVKNSALQIPHASMKNRQFVLIPLLELNPDINDPESTEPYRIISEGLPSQGVYLLPVGTL